MGGEAEDQVRRIRWARSGSPPHSQPPRVLRLRAVRLFVCAPLTHLSVTASSRRHAPRLAASVAPLAKLPTEAAPLTTEMSPRGPSSLTWGGRRVSEVGGRGERHDSSTPPRRHAHVPWDEALAPWPISIHSGQRFSRAQTDTTDSTPRRWTLGRHSHTRGPAVGGLAGTGGSPESNQGFE